MERRRLLKTLAVGVLGATVNEKPRRRLRTINNALTSWPIYRFDGGPAPLSGMNPLVPVDNRAAIDTLRARIENEIQRDDWLLLVPGTSEVGGHHHAYVPQPGENPDVDVISPEFRARLDHAHALMVKDLVPYLLISGGSVDPESPNYNEAKYGLRYLLATHAREWPDGELARRVILDPWAIHTECNVRNVDRLALALDLDRITVVTTARVGHLEDQGTLFSGGGTAIFDAICSKWLGYRLGTSQTVGQDYQLPWDTNAQPGITFATRAFLHFDFGNSSKSILGDPNWALGARELAQHQVHGTGPSGSV